MEWFTWPYILLIAGLLTEGIMAFIESDKTYKKIIVLLGALAAIIGGGFNAWDTYKQEQKSTEQESIIISLRDSLKHTTDTVNLISSNIKNLEKENDSFKIADKIIKQQSDKILAEALTLNKKEDDHYIGMQQSIGDVTEKFGYRQFNQSTEKNLIIELSNYKGSIVRLMVSGGFTEGESFSDQLSRIFHAAGWKTIKGAGTTAIGGVPNKDIVMTVYNKKSIRAANTIIGIMDLCGYKTYAIDGTNGKGKYEYDIEIIIYTFSGDIK